MTIQTSYQLLSQLFGDTKEIRYRAEVENKYRHLTPLLNMPKGSELKVPILESILSNFWHFDDTYLFWAEGLEAIVDGEIVPRDTKIVINLSHSQRILVNTNDAIKYKWIENHCISQGKEVVNMFGDAHKWILKIKPSNRRSLVYCNGACTKAQLPTLANHFKLVLPNSLIIMVVLDLYRQKKRWKQKSILSQFGNCIEDFLLTFTNNCQYNVKFIHYGNSRYLAII